MDMQFTQVAYGGCWKCLQDWQRCSASTPAWRLPRRVLSTHSGQEWVKHLAQSLIVMAFTSLSHGVPPVLRTEFLTTF